MAFPTLCHLRLGETSAIGNYSLNTIKETGGGGVRESGPISHHLSLSESFFLSLNWSSKGHLSTAAHNCSE